MRGDKWGNFEPSNSIVYRVPILRIGTLQAQGRTVAQAGLGANGRDGLTN